MVCIGPPSNFGLACDEAGRLVGGLMLHLEVIKVKHQLRHKWATIWVGLLYAMFWTMAYAFLPLVFGSPDRLLAKLGNE